MTRMTLRHAALRLLAVFSAVGLCHVLAGCAMLPEQVERPESWATTEWAETGLGRIASASTPAGKEYLSGFRLLPMGDDALAARLELARRAERTLDVQYYLIQRDATGMQFLRALRDAAVRGVRVRILIDDLYTAGEDPLLRDLAAYPNVEIRLFNPFPYGRPSLTTRLAFSLSEFGRINHRMHNKLFVADNSVAISGGRNMANEYFMRSATNNFVDLDIAAMGPVVKELSVVFDGYWNSEYVYPLASIIGTPRDPRAAQAEFDALTLAAGDADISLAQRDPLNHEPLALELSHGKLDLHWAQARVYADSPEKAAGINLENIDGTVTNEILNAFSSARSEVVMASPYFVPGEAGLARMKEAQEGHVRLVVLTNALAATDEPLVHAGYAQYRVAMLKLGVELYELSPTRVTKANHLGNFGKSLGRLHAKSAVIDRKRLFIGSMNLDGRSARENTELGLIIESPEVAGEVLQLLANDHFESTFRLKLMPDGEHIEWTAMEDGKEVYYYVDPDTSWFLRFELFLLKPFAPEQLL